MCQIINLYSITTELKGVTGVTGVINEIFLKFVENENIHLESFWPIQF